ncbi:MAG TPA: glycosyltransferase [Solirubrobacteraceae bacterium]|nr:glycosyltransferase [Solirubrobacteraceae bacterium]
MRVFQTLLAFSGNAPPQLALTRELVERGHEVRVVAHSAARARIEQTGAEFVAIRGWLPDLDITRPETDPVRDWEARTPLGAAKRMRDAPIAPLRDAVRENVELLGDWGADVVVFDWLFIAAPVAAEHVGIPAVALVHCPYPLPVCGAPPLFSGLKPMAGPLGAARDRLLNAMTRRFSAAGLPMLNDVRAEHGLTPLEDWNDQIRSVRAIYVMTAPELDFSSKAQLPPNVHYVGPAFEPFEKEWESPWPSENADPLVLISFSTSYMNQRALAQRVLDAVTGLRVRALLTAGPALDPSQLRIPDNARSVAFVSHRTVLPHAALVITHAGWQTVNAALADGVPLVCIPDGRDQPDNAARVVVAHAGVRVSKKSSPEKLRRVISQALVDQSIKQGARAMAGALARSDGATVIANELERLQVHNAVR